MQYNILNFLIIGLFTEISLRIIYEITSLLLLNLIRYTNKITEQIPPAETNTRLAGR
jgi:hypothetical protein